MFSGMSLEITLLVLAFAAAASFFIGNAMNSLLGANGFGVLGNMMILFFGFLLGRNLVQALPYRTMEADFHLPSAIGFAFAVLMLLAVIKRLAQSS
tara:strand:+ start:269 stop:556 length:288 start_codon:yes stop_codon:yes gene_type:complete